MGEHWLISVAGRRTWYKWETWHKASATAYKNVRWREWLNTEFAWVFKQGFVRSPYMSDAPICQMPLCVRVPLFVRGSYLSDAPICQMPLFVRSSYLSDAPIWQTPLYVRCSYLSAAPICQTPLYGRRPYLSRVMKGDTKSQFPAQIFANSQFPA